VWRVTAIDRQGREVARVELATGELTIGRDADRQMVLPSASVSRRHARLVVTGAQPCIVDEGSANGVLVNGVRITVPTAVDSATRIDLAEFRLQVESVLAGQVAASPGPVAERRSVPTGELVRLIAEGGPYDGRIFEVPLTDMVVGRAVDNDLVLDDPSLSRKHARIRRAGKNRIEVEDLGSSNGSFINGRKVGRGSAGPGDQLRFGELAFRIEDDVAGSTRYVGEGGGAPAATGQLVALIGGAVATLVVVITAMVVLLRKPTPVQASGKEGISKIAKQAEQHLKAGKQLYAEKRYTDAKVELEAAFELDPANAEVRRLKLLAMRAPDDDRALQTALAAATIGDRKGLDTGLRLIDEITPGSPARAQLQSKLTTALIKYGVNKYNDRDYAEGAWALCRSYEVSSTEARADPRASRTLKDAEKRLAKDRTYTRCRAAQ
jgi:pSer/pThr/pTyr-binding forkhead associated (FHA) protein